MERLSIIFSVLLITWFILFEQQIETKTIDSDHSYVDEDSMLTTENAIIEDTTDINDGDRNIPVIDNEKSVNSDNKTGMNNSVNSDNKTGMNNSVNSDNKTGMNNSVNSDNKTGMNNSVNSDNKTGMNNSESSPDDIINLNVGGQKITTFRSTLTAVPNSKLALMFTKNNKNKTIFKTKQEIVHYFFDYNPVQFQYLLDQLRAIKRMPQTPAYELDFKAPNVDVRFDFSDMLVELGLNPDRFLSPLVGTHLDLKVNSLIGWKECYRGKYNTPFNTTILTSICKGKRLLVACRSIADKKTLTVAGVGERENLFRTCTLNSYCSTTMKNNTDFYYVQNQAWGFQGRPKNFTTPYNQYNYRNNRGGSQGSFLLNPCDSSDEYSQYRLCWSLPSSVGRGGGDRCGSSKNLHNTNEWERLIYQTV